VVNLGEGSYPAVGCGVPFPFFAGGAATGFSTVALDSLAGRTAAAFTFGTAGDGLEGLPFGAGLISACGQVS
jgi:hypothetical protein